MVSFANKSQIEPIAFRIIYRVSFTAALPIYTSTRRLQKLDRYPPFRVFYPINFFFFYSHTGSVMSLSQTRIQDWTLLHVYAQSAARLFDVFILLLPLLLLSYPKSLISHISTRDEHFDHYISFVIQKAFGGAVTVRMYAHYQD